MERGLYIAASGMAAEMARQDQIANDLSNVNTPGYKADRDSQRSFGSLMVTDYATGNQVGQIAAGARIEKQVTDLSPQPTRDTGQSLDMAITGTGYFEIKTPQGTRFTRDGSFRADQTGKLVDQLGNAVMGKTGQPIKVAADGTVQGTQVGVFKVAGATKAGDSYFTGSAGGQDAGVVRTGSLETSGVDPARTIVDMLASLRNIEADQKVITTIDDSLGKGNSVGRVG